MHPHTYELGASDRELQRLRSQADALGPAAERLLDRLDLKPGWRALDMGCGPRGVMDLLSARVGSVVGVDNNPIMIEQAQAFVRANGLDNVEIVQADATDTGLPRGSFDFVHARLLLVNVPPPVAERIVAEMFALVRPGGIIAIQDVDAGSWCCEPPHPAWDTLLAPFLRIVGEGRIGRRLPAHLRRAGAVDIGYDAVGFFCPPGHLWRTLLLQFSDVTRARALQLGLVDAATLDAARAELAAHLADPDTVVLAPTIAHAWGRRPLDD